MHITLFRDIYILKGDGHIYVAYHLIIAEPTEVSPG